MKIKNRIIKTESLNWQDIKDLQPVNLKTPINLEHLKNSLVKHGFSKAFDVWQDPKTKEIYFVDGHTRSDTLRELISDGYDIPEKLTCNFLDAESKEKAVKILLEVHNQKLNPIDQETMEVWLEEIDIPLEQIEVDSLNFFVESEELEEEEEEEEKPEEGQDNVPALKKDPFVVRGDIFEIKAQGLKYRIGCLDALNPDEMNKLSQGELADLAHNDPPYGMKKEKDGVKNDNLNFDDLLEFNKDWINLQFSYLKDNGSFYCWGIDEPLMDIYSEVLKPLIKTQKATFRNLITWDKGSVQGQLSSGFRSYPIVDEKCLFVMCGVQGFNNNADNYFEGWEPIRKYLFDSCEKAGINSKKFHEILGVASNGGGMYSHHISATGSQWTLITEENYKKLQTYCQQNNIDELKKEYDELKKEYDSTKAYFNNTHDNQNNVWHFERTSNQERERTGGHATPKPLALCDRAIKSSCPENGLVIDWFAGSGSTLISAIKNKRACYTSDIDEHYTQITLKRAIDFLKNNQIEYEVEWNGLEFDQDLLN
ncbi:MAG: site-specific DNA-methyltransferase [Xenococcus sp. (in: cyanobacteria)]